MWGKVVLFLARWARLSSHDAALFVVETLRRSDLTIEDRALCTSQLIGELGATPLNDILVLNEDFTLLVNGRPLNHEQITAFRESAKAALSNRALQLIWKQLRFEAIVIGVHQAETAQQMFFSRAAIWWSQREEFFLRLLVGSSVSADDDDD